MANNAIKYRFSQFLEGIGPPSRLQEKSSNDHPGTTLDPVLSSEQAATTFGMLKRSKQFFFAC
jgi:hypothetical protein